MSTARKSRNKPTKRKPKVKKLPPHPKIYLDNNATTFMSTETKDILEQFSNVGNPSSFYPRTQDVMSTIQAKTRSVLGKVLGGTKVFDQFQVIFTSGASEANATFLRMIKDAHDIQSRRNIVMDVLTSSVEHHSMLEAVQSTPGVQAIEINPGPNSIMYPDMVDAALSQNPFVELVSVMSANNETGTINRVNSIGAVVHKYGKLFHTDATQSFGKLTNQKYTYIDAVSMSFHKVYGPIGIGMLLIKKKVVAAYDLHALIPGTQNEGYRGGTVNAGLVMAGLHALEETWTHRRAKNIKLRSFQTCLIQGLAKSFNGNVAWFEDYARSDDKEKKYTGLWILLFGSKSTKHRMPNTVQFTVYHHGLPAGNKICNILLRSCIYKKYGIAISIGSACLTGSNKASHVMDALTADVPPHLAKFVKCGVVRVSFGDHNSKAECHIFVKALMECVNQQLLSFK